MKKTAGSTYIGSQYKQKNHGSTNWCTPHTYIRAWYKPKILHTYDLNSKHKMSAKAINE